VGLAWRPETAWLLQQRQDLTFTEVIAENLIPGQLPRALLQLRDRGVRIIVHGVSLSLGGAERLAARRLDHLASLAEELHAPFISEHIAFVRGGGLEAGHLLPVPRTSSMLDILTENIRAAQGALPVPLVIENIASLFEWPNADYAEHDFLTAIVRRTGAKLLLDVANLYANSENHSFCAAAYLAALELESIAYVHIAGGVRRDGRYHDTHAHPVSTGPLELLERLTRLRPGLPVLLERDDNVGLRSELEAELSRIVTIAAPEAHIHVA
jgi:uncharacterized protein (UPF0276 family)